MRPSRCLLNGDRRQRKCDERSICCGTRSPTLDDKLNRTPADPIRLTLRKRRAFA